MDAPIDPSSFPFLVGTAIAILLLLMCSAIFSGSETALTTANRGKLHKRAERGDPGAQRALCGFRKVPDSNYGKSRTRISVSPGQ